MSQAKLCVYILIRLALLILSQNAPPSAKYRLCPGSVLPSFYALGIFLYDFFIFP
jgi:hypothetical protein